LSKAGVERAKDEAGAFGGEQNDLRQAQACQLEGRSPGGSVEDQEGKEEIQKKTIEDRSPANGAAVAGKNHSDDQQDGNT